MYEIIPPSPNFNDTAVEILELIRNSSHTLLGMWLFIHAGIKVDPCLSRGIHLLKWYPQQHLMACF